MEKTCAVIDAINQYLREKGKIPKSNSVRCPLCLTDVWSQQDKDSEDLTVNTSPVGACALAPSGGTTIQIN